MPIAAVPAYLGKDFKEASPGLRFGMYLPIWTERADQETEVKKRAEAQSREGNEVRELLQHGMDHAIQQLRQRETKKLPGLWDKNDFAAKQAWKQMTTLTRRDKDTATHLLRRQRQQAGTANAAILCLEAQSIAPFTTGLGNEHPLENGFAFLNPYGLPYLPGSGVKGVLRQAARELASGEWGDAKGWTSDRIHPVKVGRDTIDLSPIDALFGCEPAKGETHHVRGALTFWDVIPQIKGDALAVDIMTPHQSHYYQQKRDRKTGDSVSPHDSGQPNPIHFLTVPAGSGFSFHVSCDLAHLDRLARDLAHDDRWKTLLTTVFEHAFEWLGFGAKTAVGYGAMVVDTKAQASAEHALRERQAAEEKAARLASMSPQQQMIDEFVSELQTKHTQFPNFKESPNANFHNKARALAKAAHEGSGWSAEEKAQAAQAIEEWLPKLVRIDIKDERKKLKLAALRGQG